MEKEGGEKEGAREKDGKRGRADRERERSRHRERQNERENERLCYISRNAPLTPALGKLCFLQARFRLALLSNLPEDAQSFLSPLWLALHSFQPKAFRLHCLFISLLLLTYLYNLVTDGIEARCLLSGPGHRRAPEMKPNGRCLEEWTGPRRGAVADGSSALVLFQAQMC